MTCLRALSRFVGLVALLAAASAGAAPVEAVLVPKAALAADGRHVHRLRLYLLGGEVPISGVPSVEAQHGAVVGPAVIAPDGGVTVRYRPPRVTTPEADTLHVTLADARTVDVPVSLEPSGRAQLQLTVSPDPLVLARDATAQVSVHVRDLLGRPVRAPLRIGASVGKLSRLEEKAPGEYQATYSPPDERFPQVAILAAVSVADAAFAAAPLRLSARVTVPGEGEPGGTMQIAVDGRTFGPQPIGPDGKFAIPLVVPPGGHAVGLSIDALGNQQKREIDLSLPPFPRQLLAAIPNELPADGWARAEVVAFAVDARGQPERTRPPALTVARGTLSSPQAHGDGAWSWTYSAPTGAGPVIIEAPTARTRIVLRPAPPFELSLEEPPEPLGAGTERPQTIFVNVRDRAGEPVAGARLTATLAGGRVLSVDEQSPGRHAIRVVTPRDPGRAQAALHVELGGLAPGAPRRVTLHAARAPKGQLAAEAWVDDDLGLPVPGASVVLTGPAGALTVESDHYGTARLELAQPAARQFRVLAEVSKLPGLEAALDFVRVGASVRAVASLRGHGVLDGSDAPPGASLDVELPLRPSAPVELKLSVEPRTVRPGQPARVRIQLTTPDGKPADGAILYQATAGRVDLVQQVKDGNAELRFVAPASATPGTRYLLSVTETASRVTAFVEVVVR